VYEFSGAPALGSAPRSAGTPAVVGLAPTLSGKGYWVVDADGHVTAMGDAVDKGSATGVHNVVAIAATPVGVGYWLATADGNVFAFGDATAVGSLAVTPPATPIVALAPTANGSGYWLVEASGRMYPFGDAEDYGSLAQPPTSAVVGLAVASEGGGYWLVTAAGDVFAFGGADASFTFPAGAAPAHPVVAVAGSPTGRGFRVTDGNGTVYGFGDAAVDGDASGCRLPAGIVGLAASGNGTISPAPLARPNCGLDPPTTTSTTTTSTTTTSTTTTSTTTTTTTTTTTAPPSAAAFDIGLIGDTGYNGAEDATLLRVRAQMAKSKLAFVAHDGDTKPQSMPCTDTRDKAVYNVFNGFSQPFIYTPGDNEWTDCTSSLTRIASIRKNFFSTATSLGTARIPLTRQKTYVENARWTQGGVVFATLDVPGPTGKSSSAGETSARHSANVAWLNAAFDQAEATKAPAVMIIWQDDPFNGSSDSSLVATLKSRTTRFAKPVVLVHGDSHSFTLDHPWPTVGNFTRLETYGDSGTNKWVKATVDPNRPGVFSFTTITS
jgi:hypothetical protein